MITIGWREWGHLPALGISNIHMKVDTGAKTSCLHAFQLEPFMKEGEEWLRIFVHPKQESLEEHLRSRYMTKVTDSGHTEVRYG